MTRVNIKTERGQVKSARTDFANMIALVKPLYQAATAQQKQDAAAVLNNWATATQAQKINALALVVGLLSIATLYLLTEQEKRPNV